MPNIDVVEDVSPVEVSVTSAVIEAAPNGIDIGLIEVASTCELQVDITPVSADASSVSIDVISTGTSMSPESSTIVLDSVTKELEIVETCKQGPAGPIGPAGSGGLSLTEQVLSGENKKIYDLPLSTYSASDFKLSIQDLVNNFQVLKEVLFSFGTPRVKCRVMGISKKDPINHTITYVRTATNFEVYLKNNMPNTLLINGLVFPM